MMSRVLRDGGMNPSRTVEDFLASFGLCSLLPSPVSASVDQTDVFSRSHCSTSGLVTGACVPAMTFIRCRGDEENDWNVVEKIDVDS